MGSSKLDGQLDFLGLIEEYTDGQGATVRVKNPVNRKIKGKNVTESGQMTLGFFDVAEPFVAEDNSVIEEVPAAEDNSAIEEVPATEENSVIEEVPATEDFPAVEEPPVTENNSVTSELPVETEEQKSDERPATAVKKRKPAKDYLFKQCKRCWCQDCKHNSRNEAIPREMCGTMMACPACDGCVAEDMATVCEIGNAEEGCKFRAIEEGIFVPETFEE